MRGAQKRHPRTGFSVSVDVVILSESDAKSPQICGRPRRPVTAIRDETGLDWI
jgi:hypothetical protein